ncbi:MAG: methionine--tRNA ligase [Proteobacteria bacterium]|nr:methionine--tRNA ligase [Pseudomonadota bacterium]
MKKYITTPIYYVNDKPHLGSAYTTIACDVYARFHRFLKNDVFFLTGTDEHGQKIQQAAEKANLHPKQFVDNVSKSFKALTTHLKITNDDFIRTTEERHLKAAKALWKTLEEKGFIYLGKYEGYYSVRDEAFYQESELIDGKAPTGAVVEWTVEESYFFKLSEFTDKLLAYYQENPSFIMPESRRNEVIAFVKSGLHDLSISRTSFTWGVDVDKKQEQTKDHIMYVWVDALTNYLTSIGYPDKLDTERFKQAIHVVGKDILRFHAVYWPALLMAADLPLPKQIFAHGWWTVEGEKMSKSLKNTIDPIQLVDDFGIDAVRNYVLREMPFGQDGNFSMQSFITRTNADLANAFGNLVQRVFSFIYKNCDQKIPRNEPLKEHDLALMNQPNTYLKDLIKYMEDLSFNKYIETLWQIVHSANAYIDQEKPWDLKKTDPHRMEVVLYTVCETIRKIALLAESCLPIGADKILTLLNIPENNRTIDALDYPLIPGSLILEPTGIYPRIAVNNT